jgi:hypothetical protein
MATDLKSEKPKSVPTGAASAAPVDSEVADDNMLYIPVLIKATLKIKTDVRTAQETIWGNDVIQISRTKDRLQLARSVSASAKQIVAKTRQDSLNYPEMSALIAAARKEAAAAAVNYFAKKDDEGVSKPLFDVDLEIDSVVPLGLF